MTAIAILILLVHLAWIVLVIFGALWTRGRPAWSALHILALLWGIAVEAGPWPCPLTLAEQWCESRAGITPYTQPFLVHYLESTIYPDVPLAVLIPIAVVLCVFLLGIYVRRYLRRSGPNW